jgi:hypothetical protein
MCGDTKASGASASGNLLERVDPAFAEFRRLVYRPLPELSINGNLRQHGLDPEPSDSPLQMERSSAIRWMADGLRMVNR